MSGSSELESINGTYENEFTHIIISSVLLLYFFYSHCISFFISYSFRTFFPCVNLRVGHDLKNGPNHNGKINEENKTNSHTDTVSVHTQLQCNRCVIARDRERKRNHFKMHTTFLFRFNKRNSIISISFSLARSTFSRSFNYFGWRWRCRVYLNCVLFCCFFAWLPPLVPFLWLKFSFIYSCSVFFFFGFGSLVVDVVTHTRSYTRSEGLCNQWLFFHIHLYTKGMKINKMKRDMRI